jgi:hypothetical protein
MNSPARRNGSGWGTSCLGSYLKWTRPAQGPSPGVDGVKNQVASILTTPLAGPIHHKLFDINRLWVQAK